LTYNTIVDANGTIEREVVMPHPTASDLMDEFVTTLSPETDIYHAIESLLKKKLSGAPVIDASGRLVGILSEKDCLKIVAAEAFDRLPEGKVADYMTTEIVTLSPKSTVFDVVDRFLKSSFRRIPVVAEDGAFVGVVSRTRAVKAVASMRDSPELYHSPESVPPSEEGAGGVDSAMRRARGR
jgi:CBS domain-containing protein